MSAGKDAYETRKRERKEREAKMERDQIARDKREAATDEVVDLFLVAMKAFLTGEACFVVVDGPMEGAKTIAFGSIPKPAA